MTRKAVVTFLAAVALGVGVFVSSSAMADKSGRCDKTTACNDEILAACGPQPSKSCVDNLINQCKEFLCTCTGEPGLPACGAIQCCVQSSPMGAFDTCTVETPAQCFAQGGIAQGSGSCSPNPCPPPTTSTTTTVTSTSSCSTVTIPLCGGVECVGNGGFESCPQSGTPPGFGCPSGTTCTQTGAQTCACTGESIPCGDSRLSAVFGPGCNACSVGTCPPGQTCRGVSNGACGWNCACQ